MEVRSLGLKKIYIAPVSGWDNTTIPADNGSTAASTDWVDLGDVYMDSAKLTDADGSKTVHKSETSAKKIVCSKNGDTTLELQLMDPSLTLLARYFGGTVVTTGTSPNEKHTWTRPAKFGALPFALYIVPEEGDALKCACVGITPKFEITYSEEGIMLVTLTIDILGQVVITDDYDATYGPIYHAS